MRLRGIERRGYDVDQKLRDYLTPDLENNLD